jgi:hypothetical protein
MNKIKYILQQEQAIFNMESPGNCLNFQETIGETKLNNLYSIAAINWGRAGVLKRTTNEQRLMGPRPGDG